MNLHKQKVTISAPNSESIVIMSLFSEALRDHIDMFCYVYPIFFN